MKVLDQVLNLMKRITLFLSVPLIQDVKKGREKEGKIPFPFPFQFSSILFVINVSQYIIKGDSPSKNI